MYMQERSSQGITLVPLESKLLSKRKIFLEGEINGGLAMEFIRQLMCLVGEDPKAPIRILINSAGGEINSGMLIYVFLAYTLILPSLPAKTIRHFLLLLSVSHQFLVFPIPLDLISLGHNRLLPPPENIFPANRH